MPRSAFQCGSGQTRNTRSTEEQVSTALSQANVSWACQNTRGIHSLTRLKALKILHIQTLRIFSTEVNIAT